MPTNQFTHTSSVWVHYTDYEWRTAPDGKLYLTPAPDAAPVIYDPLQEAQTLVLDALHIGRMGMSRKTPDADIQAAILSFARKYGLFGLMTALPTTPDFMEYEAVYLPKNHFLKQETMPTLDYLRMFFPFEPLTVGKRGVESIWQISNDRTMQALAMTMSDKPQAVSMCLQRQYAERYDWLKQQFTDWAFNATTCFLYYEEYEDLNPATRRLMQQSISAFGGNAPTYHIELRDKPTLVWDFHSLLLGLQMMFTFMLTDGRKTLRLCKNCLKDFVASKRHVEFCCAKCRKAYEARQTNSDE